MPRVDPTSKALELPEGWLPCNGSNITQSPWEGQKTPELNLRGHFLRGGEEAEVLEEEESSVEKHTHDYTTAVTSTTSGDFCLSSKNWCSGFASLKTQMTQETEETQ